MLSEQLGVVTRAFVSLVPYVFRVSSAGASVCGSPGLQQARSGRCMPQSPFI